MMAVGPKQKKKLNDRDKFKKIRNHQNKKRKKENKKSPKNCNLGLSLRFQGKT